MFRYIAYTYRSSAISATSNGTKIYAAPPVAPANKRDVYKYHTSVATNTSTQEIYAPIKYET